MLTEVLKFLVKICQKYNYFLLFLLVFTSADIIFHKLLELHSTLPVKSIFVTNFPFVMDSPPS